jgi:hypothetical protein
MFKGGHGDTDRNQAVPVRPRVIARRRWANIVYQSVAGTESGGLRSTMLGVVRLP